MTPQQYDNLCEISEALRDELRDMVPDTQTINHSFTALYSRDYRPVHPWGTRSLNVLQTVRPELLFIANGVADVYNVSAVHGYRDEEEQTAIHEAGYGLPWPDSNHNVYPSRALDLIPYPTGYDDIPKLDMMLGAVEALAVRGGIGIRLGKYFSNMQDYAHIELI